METEFKFEVPSTRLAGIEHALRLGKVTRTHLEARYVDTPDGALARHGVVLRLRKEGRRWMQTAKAAGDGVLQRLEHNVDLGPAKRGWVPEADVRRHHGSAAGEVIERILGDDAAPLVEIYATDIWRLARLAHEGDSVIELALDVGSVTAPPAELRDPRVARVCEFEMELVEGEVADLVALASRWSKAHGLWLSTITKSARGERLRALQDHAPAVKATPPVYPTATRRSRLGGQAIQQAIVAACLRQILPNVSELAAGSQDPAHIHQARVGIRRLRTALRELDALAFDRFDAAWEAPLVDVFLALGVQRDLEVLRETIEPRLQAAGGPTLQIPVDEAAASEVGAAVRAPKFQAVLVGLAGFVSGAAPAEAKREVSAIKLLRGRLSSLHRSVLRSSKHFESMTADQRHAVRKKIKRLRYLCEFALPLYDDKSPAAYLAALAPAQDALGRLNDEAMAIRAYRALAEVDGRAWFAVGWLVGQEQARVDACGASLRALRAARPFWST